MVADICPLNYHTWIVEHPPVERGAISILKRTTLKNKAEPTLGHAGGIVAGSSASNYVNCLNHPESQTKRRINQKGLHCVLSKCYYSINTDSSASSYLDCLNHNPGTTVTESSNGVFLSCCGCASGLERVELRLVPQPIPGIERWRANLAGHEHRRGRLCTCGRVKTSFSMVHFTKTKQNNMPLGCMV